MDFIRLNENTLQFSGKYFLYSKKIKDLLIKTAKDSHKKTSRICLHSSTSENTQNMLICLLANQNFKAHKHPEGKSESYTIIEGCLYVDQYNSSKELLRSLKLQPKDGPYMHIGNTIHKPYTKNKICIYQEIYHGNFNKDFDVKYIDA